MFTEIISTGSIVNVAEGTKNYYGWSIAAGNWEVISVGPNGLATIRSPRSGAREDIMVSELRAI